MSPKLRQAAEQASVQGSVVGRIEHIILMVGCKVAGDLNCDQECTKSSIFLLLRYEQSLKLLSCSKYWIKQHPATNRGILLGSVESILGAEDPVGTGFLRCLLEIGVAPPDTPSPAAHLLRCSRAQSSGKSQPVRHHGTHQADQLLSTSPATANSFSGTEESLKVLEVGLLTPSKGVQIKILRDITAQSPSEATGWPNKF